MKAFVFDLDGTLIDSVYAHTIAWQQALDEVQLRVPACLVHRHIGISGKLLVKTLARTHGRRIDEATIDKLEKRHDVLYRKTASLQLPLPGAIQLLKFLRTARVPHGIATTGKPATIGSALKRLDIDESTIVVDGSFTDSAKPEPDLFVECQSRLGVQKSDCLVVGDAIWDVHAARRAGILSIGLLTGGFGEQELSNAGAMRVYRDAGELMLSVDELGIELNDASSAASSRR